MPNNRQDINLNFLFSYTLPMKLELKSWGLFVLLKDTIDDSTASEPKPSLEETESFFFNENENYYKG
jgi:hypothetical protein